MIMRNLFAICAAAAILIALTPASVADDDHTANTLLPACKRYLASFDGNVISVNNWFGMGRCIGILEGLNYIPLHCAPDGVMNPQVVRVVVKYIEEQPERWHEDSESLRQKRCCVRGPAKREDDMASP
jgi:hypothetical protein